MLRYMTAGESHGEALVAIIEGVPAGVRINKLCIDADLRRRMKGYGRGGRMKIEKDEARHINMAQRVISILKQ